jgi:hypothetical protein
MTAKETIPMIYQLIDALEQRTNAAVGTATSSPQILSTQVLKGSTAKPTPRSPTSRRSTPTQVEERVGKTTLFSPSHEFRFTGTRRLTCTFQNPG